MSNRSVGHSLFELEALEARHLLSAEGGLMAVNAGSSGMAHEIVVDEEVAASRDSNSSVSGVGADGFDVFGDLLGAASGFNSVEDAPGVEGIGVAAARTTGVAAPVSTEEFEVHASIKTAPDTDLAVAALQSGAKADAGGQTTEAEDSIWSQPNLGFGDSGLIEPILAAAPPPAPVIDPIPDQFTFEDVPLLFPIVVTDPDTPPMVLMFTFQVDNPALIDLSGID